MTVRLVPIVRLAIPEEAADALRGEASRRLQRPGEVLADFIKCCWPAYVATALTSDLRPVLDVRAREEEISQSSEEAIKP